MSCLAPEHLFEEVMLSEGKKVKGSFCFFGEKICNPNGGDSNDK
jgi:hypothetical protein